MGTVVVNGHLFVDNGQMTCLNGAANPPAGSTTIGAWVHKNDTSEPYVYDVGASAVPATAVLVNNVAYRQNGVLYVTTAAVAAGDARVSGLRVREDGAVRVITAAVAADDTIVGGWAMKSTGQARVSIT